MSGRPNPRVMMTTDTIGGVWVYSATLARELASNSVDVSLVTIGPRPNASQRDMLSACNTIQLIDTNLQLEWQDPDGADVATAAVTLLAIEDDVGADIVHLNSFREANLPWKAPVVLAAHSCVNSWADACAETGAFKAERWQTYSTAVAESLRKVDRWVAPTTAFRDTVTALYRPRTQGIVIWNGAGECAGPRLRKQPVILGAGRMWDKAKNLQALRVAAPGLQWPVRIAGPTSEQHPFLAADAAGIVFLGELGHDAVLAQMQEASIFVSPALYEPFGLSVLEAARAGCALVLSDIATFRELWDGAAIFVDPHVAADLHHALQSLSSDELLRKRLQRAAIERAKRYPISRTAGSYRALYRSMTSSQPALGRSSRGARA